MCGDRDLGVGPDVLLGLLGEAVRRHRDGCGCGKAKAEASASVQW